MELAPRRVVGLAHAHRLAVQFEIGEKQGGMFTRGGVDALVRQGAEWLEAGACEVVVEARESARGIGIFAADGALDLEIAGRLADAFGMDSVSFEAPTKASQFALIDHLGPTVRLANVRLEEILRLEAYRRGLHSDAFGNARLRPSIPRAAEAL